jgi:predicted RNA-binding Zn-ribbon protein involved in translation (DUF1610 family)
MAYMGQTYSNMRHLTEKDVYRCPECGARMKQIWTSIPHESMRICLNCGYEDYTLEGCE